MHSVLRYLGGQTEKDLPKWWKCQANDVDNRLPYGARGWKRRIVLRPLFKPANHSRSNTRLSKP